MRKVPCNTCPWRLSSKVGGADIPNFCIDKMKNLANTVGEGDDFRTVMACHYSGEEGTEIPCVGYVAQAGISNLNVRIMAARNRGDIDWANVQAACDEIEMWPDFHTMLDAYVAAYEGEGCDVDG